MLRLLDALLAGLTLGGLYSLVSLGLNLQFGVARILNLSYGEVLIAAAMVTWAFQTKLAIAPPAATLVILPVAALLGWATYRWALMPLVRRSPSREALEVDSLLATFGLLFLVQGLMLAAVGGEYLSYSYLSVPVEVFGTRLGANRLLALAIAVAAGLLLYLALMRTRLGTAVRAIAVDPQSAQLVGIDVRRLAATAFAGGALLSALTGVLVSMFLTFSATMGVVFTLKALIVIIMGGVGNLMGGIVAGLMLGLAEAIVATFVDPGLTLASNYALFLLVLLFWPNGLFGGRAR